jgi:hypothetical protein
MRCIYPSERAPHSTLYLFIIRNDEMLPLENTIGAAGLQSPRLIHGNSPFLSIVVLLLDRKR